MISNFELKNLSTGEKVTMGMDIIYDYVYKEDGLDWGSVPGNHNTYNYLGQVGESIYSSELKTRDISITGYVYYRLTDEERKNVKRHDIAEHIHEKLKEKKKKLNDMINPLEFVRITTNGYYIEGKPSSSISYGKDRSTNNEYFCQFLISIFCNNPMFKKETIVKTVMSGSYGVFHFPLTLVDFGYVMGTRINYLMLMVENEGNVPVGGIITLTAKGEVKNPELENIETGEIIRVNKTMVRGEKIIINTSPGKGKDIIVGVLNGKQYNYLKYWSYANSLFKFQRGISMIGYSTQNNSEMDLSVVVEFNPEKLALEDM